MARHKRRAASRCSGFPGLPGAQHGRAVLPCAGGDAVAGVGLAIAGGPVLLCRAALKACRRTRRPAQQRLNCCSEANHNMPFHISLPKGISMQARGFRKPSSRQDRPVSLLAGSAMKHVQALQWACMQSRRAKRFVFRGFRHKC